MFNTASFSMSIDCYVTSGSVCCFQSEELCVDGRSFVLQASLHGAVQDERQLRRGLRTRTQDQVEHANRQKTRHTN